MSKDKLDYAYSAVTFLIIGDLIPSGDTLQNKSLYFYVMYT